MSVLFWRTYWELQCLIFVQESLICFCRNVSWYFDFFCLCDCFWLVHSLSYCVCSIFFIYVSSRIFATSLCHLLYCVAAWNLHPDSMCLDVSSIFCRVCIWDFHEFCFVWFRVHCQISCSCYGYLCFSFQPTSFNYLYVDYFADVSFRLSGYWYRYGFFAPSIC